jgi:FixJ family two-component response regulator
MIDVPQRVRQPCISAEFLPERTLNADMPQPLDTPIVYVVDDDISVRESLELWVACVGWRVETFASAREFLSLERAKCPSCLVLDLSLPDQSGLDLQQALLGDRVMLPIIFITGHGDVPRTVQAMKAGAVEFLTKPFDEHVMGDAIRQALARSEAALKGEAELRQLRERHAALSEREREVMALVATGLLNKQAGIELGISEITVKAHRGKVMRKMCAGSFADLVKMANRLGVAVAKS